MIATLMLAAVAALASVHGDFDHDGKPDVARLIRKGARIDLVLWRGAAPARAIRLYDFDPGADAFIDKARPGRWRTACGKGMGAEHDPCPRKSVRLRGDTLSFGVRESTEIVALWTGRRFETVWLSE